MTRETVALIAGVSVFGAIAAITVILLWLMTSSGRATVGRFYPIARDTYRFGGLNPRTYLGILRLWRAERRVMRHGRQVVAMIEVLDATPQLRRAMRHALRVKGHAADEPGPRGVDASRIGRSSDIRSSANRHERPRG